MSDEKGMHTGHKRRLRDKFCKNDNFFVFEDHEIIEMMLNYVSVRRNQNDIAHKLVKRFKNVKGVLDASRYELEDIEGVGDSVATYILMIRQLFAKYNRDANYISNTNVPHSELTDYIKALFDGIDKETIFMLCVGMSGKIINQEIIGTGTETGVLLDRKKILSIAINSKATSVIFAHNHPVGFAVASEEDIVSTKAIERYLKDLEIGMVDHFIVAEDKCISIREDSRYKYYK